MIKCDDNNDNNVNDNDNNNNNCQVTGKSGFIVRTYEKYKLEKISISKGCHFSSITYIDLIEIL